MRDGWTNAKGTDKIYPDDFAILNEVTVYRCAAAGKRVIISNGIPDHDLTIEQNHDGICEIPYALEMPLDPVYDDSLPIKELPVRGIIAMARNGVPAYGPQESDSLNALGNVTTKIDASFWYGHRGPDQGWHTHNPNMGNEVVDSSTFMGWAMDGFEIYGPLSDEEVNSGALDECNGKIGDDGNYRYHVRKITQVDGVAEYCVSGYNNAENDPRITWKYILGCYSGDISDTKVYDSRNYTLSDDCIVEGTPTESPSQNPTRDPNAPPRPNIIVMQPDDLVFMDAWTPPPKNPKTPNKQNTFPDSGMPNIDGLRTGGLQMMQAYTASPMCGTSRYSTITGKMPGRSATIRALFDDQPSDVTIPNTKLEDEDCSSENLAAVLKGEDYATAMVGKWHLSKINRNTYTYAEAVNTVKKCGFEYVSGLYMENIDEKNGFNEYVTGNFSHNMEWITHEAIKFINETTSQPDPEPFFMYFNPTVPHGSQNVLDALTNFTCTDTAEGNGGEEPWVKGMSEDDGCEAYRQTVIDRANGDYDDLGKIWLDDSVGALVQALKDNGVYENTIFLFQEDHGMFLKGALYEGGTRIPQFVHYPDGIAAGTTLDVPVSTVDVAATMMDYAGIDVLPYQMDGTSWKDVIGNADKIDFWKNERCLFFELDEDRAVRCGCYKYLLIDNDSSDTYLEGQAKGLAANVGGMLFDLCDGTDDYITANDNNMEIDLIDNASVLSELQSALDCFNDNTNPGADPGFGACGNTESPTLSPSGSPSDSPSQPPSGEYDCLTDDGRAGQRLELEFYVDEKSGAEFSWELRNQLVETSGWVSNQNFNHPTNEKLKYAVCIPFEECWNLALSDSGGDGLGEDGSYVVYLAGDDIHDGGNFGSSVTHEICLGKSEHCDDTGKKLRVIAKRRIRKQTELGKSFRCDELGSRRLAKPKWRNKLCRAKIKQSGGKKVRSECILTCGKVGEGDCSFLDVYGKDGQPTVAPGNLISLDYIPV